MSFGTVRVLYMFTVIRYLYIYILDLRVPDDNSRDNTAHQNTTRNYVVRLLVNLCGRTNPKREHKEKKNPHEKCFSQKLVPTLISRLIRSKYKRRLVIFYFEIIPLSDRTIQLFSSNYMQLD